MFFAFNFILPQNTGAFLPDRIYVDVGKQAQVEFTLPIWASPVSYTHLDVYKRQHLLGRKLIELSEKDRRITAVTAAMPTGTGLSAYQERFPKRCFDVGIAEEHGVTMSAGMAKAGMRPYFAVYASFLQRAYDQILTDVCSQGLPVTLCVDRAGRCV